MEGKMVYQVKTATDLSGRFSTFIMAQKVAKAWAKIEEAIIFEDDGKSPPYPLAIWSRHADH